MNKQLKQKVSQKMVMLKGSKQLGFAQNGFKAAVAMKGMHADIRETQLLLQINETLGTCGLRNSDKIELKNDEFQGLVRLL